MKRFLPLALLFSLSAQALAKLPIESTSMPGVQIVALDTVTPHQYAAFQQKAVIQNQWDPTVTISFFEDIDPQGEADSWAELTKAGQLIAVNKDGEIVSEVCVFKHDEKVAQIDNYLTLIGYEPLSKELTELALAQAREQGYTTVISKIVSCCIDREEMLTSCGFAKTGEERITTRISPDKNAPQGRDILLSVMSKQLNTNSSCSIS